MKTVLFLMRYPLEQAYNLKQKFDGQMQATVNLGYKTYYLAYDNKSVYLVKVNDGSKQRICGTTFGSFKKYRSTFGFYDLFRALSKVLKGHRFDYIYMRSKIVGRTAIQALKKHRSLGGQLIVEIPSYSSQEQSLSRVRTMIKAFLSRWQKKLSQCVDLYTIIGTSDLTVYENRPALCISNGVCVDNFPIHQCIRHDEIRILALASMRSWHAYDRLIRGLAAYQGDTPVHIEMVGNDGDGSLAEWKVLAEGLGIAHLVHFRGALYGEALTEMVNTCDIGAATLGFHRNSSGNASVLKVREYAARGLPFLYAYEDTALNGSEEFALKFVGDETPIDLDQVVPWVNHLRLQEDLTEQIRSFARQHMSWESQFESIFAVLEK